jgi:integrase/recombinase XerD
VLRPLSPNTRAQYEKALERGVTNSEAGRRLLRAALRRQALEEGVDPEVAIRGVPPPAYAIKHVREFLSESDTQRYEGAARELPPGRRALALLPLALGLRASSVISLKRRDVERALAPDDSRAGQLLVLVKRGKESLKPIGRVRSLLEELLGAPAAPGRRRLTEPRKGSRRWETAGEILSAGSQISQYHALRDLVEATGRSVGLKDLSPHDLRHAFASRMLRDGATLGVTIADVQRALDHESLQTTMIYVHSDPEQMARFMRQF